KRFGSVVVARPNERYHPRNIENEIKKEINRGLDARGEEAIEHVTSDVCVGTESVGPSHHEQCAVEHIHDVKSPRPRVREHIARKDLIRCEEGENKHRPTEGMADFGVYPVDSV